MRSTRADRARPGAAEVVVVVCRGVVADESRLHRAEHELLAALGLTGARRREWIRGRLAAHHAIARAGFAVCAVLADPDGAPRPADRDLALSLSHDDDRVAVAVTRGAARLGVDLCSAAAGVRLARLLPRLGVCAADGEAVRSWAALECAHKLRRRSIVELLRGGVSVECAAGRATVRGLGAPVHVALRWRDDHVLAWSAEPCPVR
jgi:hypothetical protein